MKFLAIGDQKFFIPWPLETTSDRLLLEQNLTYRKGRTQETEETLIGSINILRFMGSTLKIATIETIISVSSKVNNL